MPAFAGTLEEHRRPRRPFRSTWKNLFLYRGRIGAGEWWALGALSILLALLGLYLVVTTEDGLSRAIGVGLMLLAVWISLTSSVKRWHDRDKPGTWHFVGSVPWVGGIWETVELGFRDGTPGRNTYGDPDSGSVFR